MLKVENLWARVEDKIVLKGINLKIEKGQFHALMGPNGSGKSSLANVIMGNPSYEVIKGKIEFEGTDLLSLKCEERAKLKIFLVFQSPQEIDGVNLENLIWSIKKESDIKKAAELRKSIIDALHMVDLPQEFSKRALNLGFSGGEKKRSEVAQMLILKPKLALIDEVDSGLDIDSIKTVAKAINSMAKRNNRFSSLIITHYPRILNFVRPDFVHVMHDGRILKSSGPELAVEIEEKGYEEVFKNAGP